MNTINASEVSVSDLSGSCDGDTANFSDDSAYLQWCGLNELLDTVELEGITELSDGDLG